MADPVIGIDLGTTFSAVGIVEAGFPILLANEEGERLVPSVVWFGPGGVKVGHAALAEAPEDRLVRSAKRCIGLRMDEAGGSDLPVQEASDGGLAFVTAEGPVTPVEASSAILSELKRIAEFRLEREVHRAVITVPAYFNNAQREATKRAGEAVGLEVIRLVAEPTAAALAYGMNKLAERARVAVFDLGGGTFDVSLLEMREGVFEVLATGGDTRLGGDDVDNAVLALVSRATGVELLQRPEKRGNRDRLRREAERVKRELSEVERATFRVPWADGSGNLEAEVCREDLEIEIAAQLGTMKRICREVLVDAGLAPEQLEAVVMVGGSSRIPVVQQLAGEVFGREPDCSQHPDEVVAQGAVIQAGILAGTWRDVLLLDVTPLSLGIETLGGLMNVLIPRNTTIPCKAGEMFTNVREGQESMRVRVLQGERELAQDNWELGLFDLPFQSAPRGKARVGVQFSLDENGILEVLARDVEGGGADVIVKIESAAVDVSEEAVEQMVEESVEHAFDDMKARVFAEARIKAEELLPAVRAALAQLGAALEVKEKEEIVAAQRAVEDCLEGGEANALKDAVERLDGATEALAARLVEEALAARMGGEQTDI
ncbi:MAG: molecular chaperone DnaK [Verrucomicrobiaceae bacterium]|nr:molecular chaperone DnaK [Verrucomicrobiaceae bacterium]